MNKNGVFDDDDDFLIDPIDNTDNTDTFSFKLLLDNIPDHTTSNLTLIPLRKQNITKYEKHRKQQRPLQHNHPHHVDFDIITKSSDSQSSFPSSTTRSIAPSIPKSLLNNDFPVIAGYPVTLNVSSVPKPPQDPVFLHSYPMHQPVDGQLPVDSEMPQLPTPIHTVDLSSSLFIIDALPTPQQMILKSQHLLSSLASHRREIPPKAGLQTKPSLTKATITSTPTIPSLNGRVSRFSSHQHALHNPTNRHVSDHPRAYSPAPSFTSSLPRSTSRHSRVPSMDSRVPQNTPFYHNDNSTVNSIHFHNNLHPSPQKTSRPSSIPPPRAFLRTSSLGRIDTTNPLPSTPHPRSPSQPRSTSQTPARSTSQTPARSTSQTPARSSSQTPARPLPPQPPQQPQQQPRNPTPATPRQSMFERLGITPALSGSVHSTTNSLRSSQPPSQPQNSHPLRPSTPGPQRLPNIPQSIPPRITSPAKSRKTRTQPLSPIVPRNDQLRRNLVPPTMPLPTPTSPCSLRKPLMPLPPLPPQSPRLISTTPSSPHFNRSNLGITKRLPQIDPVSPRSGLSHDTSRLNKPFSQNSLPRPEIKPYRQFSPSNSSRPSHPPHLTNQMCSSLPSIQIHREAISLAQITGTATSKSQQSASQHSREYQTMSPPTTPRHRGVNSQLRQPMNDDNFIPPRLPDLPSPSLNHTPPTTRSSSFRSQSNINPINHFAPQTLPPSTPTIRPKSPFSPQTPTHNSNSTNKMYSSTNKMSQTPQHVKSQLPSKSGISIIESTPTLSYQASPPQPYLRRPLQSQFTFEYASSLASSASSSQYAIPLPARNGDSLPRGRRRSSVGDNIHGIAPLTPVPPSPKIYPKITSSIPPTPTLNRSTYREPSPAPSFRSTSSYNSPPTPTRPRPSHPRALNNSNSNINNNHTYNTLSPPQVLDDFTIGTNTMSFEEFLKKNSTTNNSTNHQLLKQRISDIVITTNDDFETVSQSSTFSNVPPSCVIRGRSRSKIRNHRTLDNSAPPSQSPIDHGEFFHETPGPSNDTLLLNKYD